jgi:AraC-like DNA-binding protein
MNHGRGLIEQVAASTAAIMSTGGPTRIEDVAYALYMSRSTLQRRLADSGTCFTEIRRGTQVRVALDRLTSGASCAQAARAVGLTVDHLCRIVTVDTGIRPREIARASALAARARRWKRSAPPRFGTRLYTERAKRWHALETELDVVLAPIPASGHPLSAWASRTRRACRRPDYRRGPYRARAHAARQRERTIEAAERRSMEAWWTRFRELQRENLNAYIAQLFHGSEAPRIGVGLNVDTREVVHR